MIIVCFAIICLSVLSKAQIPSAGRCPNIIAKSDFNMTQFLGKWYEAEKYFAFYESIGRCITATFTSNGTGFGVEHKEINYLNGLDNSGWFEVSQPGNPKEGNLVVMIPIPQLGLPLPLAFKVVETDYDNYGVLSACIDFIFAHIKFAWILTRERFPSSLSTPYAWMDSRNMDRGILLKTEHYLCPPEH